MKIRSLMVAFMATACLSVTAQSLDEVGIRKMVNEASEAQLVVEASRMLQEDYYYFSEIVVDKLLTYQPNSSNYHYRKGFIQLYSASNFEEAKKHLEIAVQKINNNYDMYSHKETAAPADAYYHLAKVYHWEEKLDKAAEYYNLFITNSKKKSALLPKATLGLHQLQVAKKELGLPRKAIVTNLGDKINSTYGDYSSVISLDGRSLYYTSRRPWANGESDEYRDPMLNNYTEDIFLSVKEGNTWSTPQRIDLCVPDRNEAPISVSIDERRIYTYQDITGNGDIYFSDFKNNSYQELQKVDITGLNTNYWEPHCSVTPDGLNIYFSSDRPGGYGGRDIYRIVKLPDGSWSQPINLGPEINTEYDEDSPFIAIDNKTMYFSSNGPNSMGGFDVFVSVRDENNEWSPSINLGSPINSTGDDLYFTTTANGKKAYLTSYRKNGHGDKDIYEIEDNFLGAENIVVLKGNLHNYTDKPLSEQAHVLLRCISCNTNPEKISLRPRDGAFLKTVEPCAEYELTFMKDDNTALTTQKFNTDCNAKYSEIYKEDFITDYQLAGRVFDRATGENLADVKVKVVDTRDGSTIATYSTDVNGNWSSDYFDTKKIGDSIALVFHLDKDKYLKVSNTYTAVLGKQQKHFLEYPLEKIAVGVDIANVIEINPIYFDLDKADIRPDAKIELDKIVEIMLSNPGIVIELGSHTDCRASKAYNLSLSDRRAKASASYIVSRIKDKSRIYGKGYGESKLVNDCACEGEVEVDCTEEQHQENRRTEFKIVKFK